MEDKFKRIARRLFNYFVRGLLFVAPVGLTFLLLFSAFDTIDSLFRIRFESQQGVYFIPGLGFLLILIGTILIGFIFTVLLPQTIQIWIENGIARLPLVKIFYSAFKDLISAFVGEKKKFDKPVLITINKEANIKKIGFLTRSDMQSFGLSTMVAVYCPHSYAFSGEMFIVPLEQVEFINLSTAEAMKMIVSGGVSIKDE